MVPEGTPTETPEIGTANHEPSVGMRNHWVTTTIAVLLWLVVAVLNVANIVCWARELRSVRKPGLHWSVRYQQKVGSTIVDGEVALSTLLMVRLETEHSFEVHITQLCPV